MNCKLHIRVQLRKSKNNSVLKPIYLRVTLNKERFEFFINQYVDPRDWDKRNKLAFNNHNLNIEINKSINRVYKYISEIELEGITLNSKNLKDRLTGKTKNRSVLQVIQSHNDLMSKKVPKLYSKGTLKITVLYNHVEAFLEKNKKRY